MSSHILAIIHEQSSNEKLQKQRIFKRQFITEKPMTYSNQEVPNWEIYQESMYDLNLPEVIPENLDIKLEETYSPLSYQVSETFADFA